jgi:excisionase family DNA binding protein
VTYAPTRAAGSDPLMMATLALATGLRRLRWDNAPQATHGSTTVHASSSTRAADPYAADPDRKTYETTPPMMDDDSYWEAFPDTLSTADVAKILSVGKPAVLVRLKSGMIPGHLVVGSWVVFKAEVRAWLESTSNQIPPAPPEPVDVLAGYADEMSYRDLMELFGKSKQTIYTWLHDGEIPAFHVGTRWIIRKSQLRQKLEETSNQPAREDS